MELLCIQSQEHDKLPLAELKAVIECEDMELDISKITEGLILLKDILKCQRLNTQLLSLTI